MQKPFRLFLYLILLFLYSAMLNAQFFNRDVEAEINVDFKGVLTTITFSAFNKTSLSRSLSYRALIVKNSTPDSPRETFEDEQFFILESNERKNISTATIKIAEKQRTIVFVLIYEDKRVIGKDRIVINGFEGEDSIEPRVVQKEDILARQSDNQASDISILRGLVVENTKTKPGRDFYQMFYLAYRANNINGEKTVKVEEVLAIGGNTQIKIFAGDDLVAQFFMNPRSSYLKEMVDQSIIRVNQYFETNKAIRQNSVQY